MALTGGLSSDSDPFVVGCWPTNKGPSIKYVTLFLVNFDTPSPLSHFVTHPETPKLRHTSRTPRFLVGLVQKTRTKAPCTNSLSIVRGGFCLGAFVKGSFVWKVLSWVVFVHSTSVRIHLLQQKVKNHFKFHVSYV